MKGKPAISHILEEFKRELQEIAGDRLKKVVLFGSHARGEAAGDSDIDVILLFSEEPSHEVKRRIRDVSNALSLKHDAVIAEFIFTESEFQRYQTPFILNIKREGIAI